jgi:hypothetical protein
MLPHTSEAYREHNREDPSASKVEQESHGDACVARKRHTKGGEKNRAKIRPKKNPPRLDEYQYECDEESTSGEESVPYSEKARCLGIRANKGMIKH